MNTTHLLRIVCFLLFQIPLFTTATGISTHPAFDLFVFVRYESYDYIVEIPTVPAYGCSGRQL